jgi:hypothetical protein
MAMIFNFMISLHQAAYANKWHTGSDNAINPEKQG